MIRKIKKMLRENCYFKSGIIDKTRYDYKTNKTSKQIMNELKKIGVLSKKYNTNNK